MAVVANDQREHEVTIARFLTESGEVPTAPNPAWCLIVDGRSHSTYRVGEERALLEAYFRAGKDGAKAA